MAAKMLDLRKPKRTRTESAAQPMAEQMATISANKGVNWDLDTSELSDKPSAPGFATAKKRNVVDGGGRFGLRWTRLLA